MVGEAIKLVSWLHAQQLELRDLCQDLLDAWIADGQEIRRRAWPFIAWLQRADFTGALHVAWPYDFLEQPALQDEQRFAGARPGWRQPASGLTVVGGGLYREYRRHSWTIYPSARPVVNGSAWLPDHRPSGLAAVESGFT